MLTIEGERILLRDHVAGDLPVMHAWITDPQVSKYLSWRTHTLEETMIMLAENIREASRPDRAHFFMALLLKETGQILGEAGFSIESRGDHGEGGVADIGYFLFPEYWGKGYAGEAGRLLIEYCFTAMKLHKVTASCDAENHPSEQVMIRCGMQREGLRRKHRLLDGEWRDRLEYAILYEDWLQSR
jgi:ribosomal-protein-alanine N-acetyltransferase